MEENHEGTAKRSCADNERLAMGERYAGRSSRARSNAGGRTSEKAVSEKEDAGEKGGEVNDEEFRQLVREARAAARAYRDLCANATPEERAAHRRILATAKRTNAARLPRRRATNGVPCVFETPALA
jgi:hypothetical protein